MNGLLGTLRNNCCASGYWSWAELSIKQKFALKPRDTLICLTFNYLRGTRIIQEITELRGAMILGIIPTP